MKSPSILLTSLTIVAFLIVTVSAFSQGSLIPPGAPGPIMKTLDQIEARTPIGGPAIITNSGSYYLTTNLTLASGSAIQISTNAVTLDLNGFTLSGNLASYGILVTGAFTNIIVRNGILRKWGIGIYSTSANTCEFDHLQLTQNNDGIYGGDSTRVSDCIATANTQIGILVGSGSQVLNCISRLNISDGIQGNSGCSIIGCLTEYNGADGIAMDRGIVKDCTARNNTNNGINVFINCLVINNTCLDNKICGINLGNGGHRIDGNNVDNNAYGIGPTNATRNLIIHNSAQANATNYNLSAINSTGPIVNTGGIATDTSPHANFSY